MQVKKKKKQNCPWQSPDTELTRQGLSHSCFKYIQLTKGNHVWITKGKYENAASSNMGYKEVIKLIKFKKWKGTK